MIHKILFVLSFSLTGLYASAEDLPREEFWEAVNTFDRAAHRAADSQEVARAQNKFNKIMARMDSADVLRLSISAYTFERDYLSGYALGALEQLIASIVEKSPQLAIATFAELGGSKSSDEIQEANSLLVIVSLYIESGAVAPNAHSAQNWLRQLYSSITEMNSSTRILFVDMAKGIVQQYPELQFFGEDELQKLRELAIEDADRGFAIAVGKMLFAIEDEKFIGYAPALIRNDALRLNERMHYLTMLWNENDPRAVEILETLLDHPQTQAQMKQACLSIVSSECTARVLPQIDGVAEQLAGFGLEMPKARMTAEEIKAVAVKQLDLKNDPRVIISAVGIVGLISLVDPEARNELVRLREQMKKKKVKHTDLEEAIDVYLDVSLQMDMLQQEATELFKITA